MKRIVGLMATVVMEVGVEDLAKVFELVKVDGYIRGTYQVHDVKGDRTYEDDGLGGKLHIETGSLNGISVGSSFYTSNAIVNNENKGLVSLRGESYKAYSILGEAYIKAEFEKNLLKVGRQELETPFAQLDDIRMVPNSFEAAILETKDIKNTTIFLAQLQEVNGSNSVQILGITYEGITDLILAGWYYNLKEAEVDKIAYFEANYEKELGDMHYMIGMQYAHESYSKQQNAKIYGGVISATDKRVELTLITSYTKAKNNAAFSGFGGAPFFSNSKYLILDNSGKDGDALSIGGEYDVTKMGIDGLTLGLGYIRLTNEVSNKATELDFTTSYEINENAELHLIASRLKATNVGEDDAKHLHVFANYNF